METPSHAARTDRSDPSIRSLVAPLLDWFKIHARDLPWRHTADAYSIWISEVMLQQTQVQTVIPYWLRWMQTLPTLADLASAPESSVLKLWEGLGYYSRARNLQRAAKIICTSKSGAFPTSNSDLQQLPGIGPYTAGAIASIAFNQPEPIVDGNIVRVMTRLFAIPGDPKSASVARQIWTIATLGVQWAAALELESPQTYPRACSHWNQALMELGATICTPTNPKCSECPIRSYCKAAAIGQVTTFPQIAARPTVTPRSYITLLISHPDGWLLHRRPASGLNARLWEFPNWEVPSDHSASCADWFKKHFGLPQDDLEQIATVRHSITRYRMVQSVHHWPCALISPPPIAELPGETKHVRLGDMEDLALTGPHRRLVRKLRTYMLEIEQGESGRAGNS